MTSTGFEGLGGLAGGLVAAMTALTANGLASTTAAAKGRRGVMGPGGEDAAGFGLECLNIDAYARSVRVQAAVQS